MKWATHTPLAAALAAMLMLPVAIQADHDDKKNHEKDHESQVSRLHDDKEDHDKKDHHKKHKDGKKHEVKKEDHHKHDGPKHEKHTAYKPEMKEHDDVMSQVGVFELEHRDPVEIRQVLKFKAYHMLKEKVHKKAAEGTEHPAEIAKSLKPMAVAIDEENRLLFVRGTEEQVKKVEKLVDAVDVQGDELAEIDLENVCFIPIKEDKARNVEQVLSELHLKNHQVMKMGETHVVAVYSDEEGDAKKNKKHITKVLDELDAKKKDKSDKEDKKKSDHKSDDKDKSDKDDDKS